jgi:putative hydrolase of the HAD superfamily
MQKRAVFFDVDGVLIHGYHAKPELRKFWDERIEQDLGVNREHFKENFIYRSFIHEVLIGKKDLNTALSEYLATVNNPTSADVLSAYWLKNDSNVNVELIDKIKVISNSEKVRLYIATNQEHLRANYLMTNLGFSEYFEDIFHSARINHIKPDKAYFDGIMKILGEFDEPPIFFDDTQAVVDVANNYGWEAHQFDNVDDLKKSNFINSLFD